MSELYEKHSYQWENVDVMSILTVYRKYEELWDPNNFNYTHNSVRQNNFIKLLIELNDLGILIPSTDHLRNLIKSIYDVYDAELNKINDSKKGGAGIYKIYKPTLAWFDVADSFMGSIQSGRESSLNQYLSHRQHRLDSMEVGKNTTQNDTQSLCTDSESSTSSAEMISRFQESVSQLQDIAQLTNYTKDEYDRFGLHIAAQLRELPAPSYVLLQDKIQHLVTMERLMNMTPLVTYEATLPTSNYDYYTGSSSSLASVRQGEFLHLQASTTPQIPQHLKYEITQVSPSELNLADTVKDLQAENELLKAICSLQE